MHKETHATKPEYGYSSKGKCFLIGNKQQIICIKKQTGPHKNEKAEICYLTMLLPLVQCGQTKTETN